MADTATKTEKYLHMEFLLDNGKTATLKLKDPKENLEGSAVKAVMDAIIGKSFLLVGAALPTAAQDAYVIETTKTTTDVDISGE